MLTVHFSNHTGYPAWRGPLLAAADVAEVVTGIDERGVLAGSTPCCRAIRAARTSGPSSSMRSPW